MDFPIVLDALVRDGKEVAHAVVVLMCGDVPQRILEVLVTVERLGAIHVT